ncbi:hypothetical protein ES703_92096 [subsurface metagenome]
MMPELIYRQHRIQEERRVSKSPLSILIVASLLIILLPQEIMAQEEKGGLSLRCTPSDHIRITAGSDKVLLLEVKNTGTKRIDDIVFSALKLEDWLIEFKPERIASLSSEESVIVDVTIKPPHKTAERTHQITLRADSITADRAISIRIWVESPKRMWLLIGGILAVVVVAVFVIIFLRFGRQ